MIDSDLPESEKKPHRVADEAQTAIAAGTLTSSHALKAATYHILANPDILERLMTELESAMPEAETRLTLKELEELEYLGAVMYESFRISHGVAHRLQRICPDQPIQYREWTIPPGTPVGITSVHVHEEPTIFEDPYSFKPERWLPWATHGQGLQRYLMSFGKGTRQCIGMELAKAEILTALAAVFRRFGRVMELYDTDRERDIDFKRDLFNPAPSVNSNGLKVFFKKQ